MINQKKVIMENMNINKLAKLNPKSQLENQSQASGSTTSATSSGHGSSTQK